MNDLLPVLITKFALTLSAGRHCEAQNCFVHDKQNATHNKKDGLFAIHNIIDCLRGKRVCRLLPLSRCTLVVFRLVNANAANRISPTPNGKAGQNVSFFVCTTQQQKTSTRPERFMRCECARACHTDGFHKVLTRCLGGRLEHALAHATRRRGTDCTTPPRVR